MDFISIRKFAEEAHQLEGMLQMLDDGSQFELAFKNKDEFVVNYSCTLISAEALMHLQLAFNAELENYKLEIKRLANEELADNESNID